MNYENCVGLKLFGSCSQQVKYQYLNESRISSGNGNDMGKIKNLLLKIFPIFEQ